MAEALTVVIEIDDGKAKKTLKTFETDASDTAKKMGGSIGGGAAAGILGAINPVKVAIAGLIAAAGAAFSIKKIVDEAVQGENALNQFNASLRAIGAYTPEASKSFERYSGSLQKITTVADDVIQQNAALLVSVGRLSGEGLNKATKAALDLSAGLQIDVGTAFDLMSKAATGNTAALSRYGLKIASTVPENERFAASLSLINKSFGGMAEQQVNTFGGAVKQLGNNFSDMLESLGKSITQSGFLREVIKSVSNIFAQAAEAIDKWLSGRDIIYEIVTAVLWLAKVITQYMLPPFELLYNAAVFVFNAIKTGINTIIFGFLYLAEQAASALGYFSSSAQAFSEEISLMKETVASEMEATAAQTTAAAANMFNFDTTSSVDLVIEKIKAETGRMKQEAYNSGQAVTQSFTQGATAGAQTLGQLFTSIANAFKNTSNKMKLDANQLAQTMNQTLGNGIANAFVAMGEAFGKGENGFAALGKSLLGVVADLCIQMGTFMMLAGLGFGLLGNWSAFGAIAVGAGLLVLGGVIKGLIGGGGKSSAPSTPTGGAPGQVMETSTGTGGGIASSPSEATAMEEETTRSRGQAVVVNIHGNVLDRRQTGLEIADVINETFGTNSLAIQEGAIA